MGSHLLQDRFERCFTDFNLNNDIIEDFVRHCGSHKTTANDGNSILCETLMRKKL